MRFWDTSALVPLIIEESSSKRLRGMVQEDPAISVWWTTEVECASALSRVERDASLDPAGSGETFRQLQELVATWQVVDPSEAVRATAVRFLRVHPLRAADALQLAAAFEASGRQPSSLEIVTLDDRLASAARREGFAVVTSG